MKVIKTVTVFALIISILMGCVMAETPEERRNNPAKMYGGGFIKHYKPAEDKAEELCEGLTTQQEKFDAITHWLNKCIHYDYGRQTYWKKLDGPDIKYCFDHRTGICMDISALACCMLRKVGIRANVVFGFAEYKYIMNTDCNGVREYDIGKTWHAWCEVFIDGEKIWYDQDVGRRNRYSSKNYYVVTYTQSHVAR